jgi:NAD/NADP transhydrogenase beta subunit
VSDRYPTPQFRRTALAPSTLCAIVLLAGVALVGLDGYLIIRFAVAILALVVAVFAWQAHQWWWIPLLAAIAVVFNPVVIVPITGDLLLAAHYVSALVLIAVGVLVKVPNPEDRNRR